MKSYRRVRVTSGSLRGIYLRYPQTKALRPTMQRAKISIFDSIQEILAGAVFADLFAAAGAMGIEALSRGASFVHFLENDAGALRMLELNLRRCSLPGDKFKIHPYDVFSFLARGGFKSIEPDIIFADPPYSLGAVPNLLDIFRRKRYDKTKMIIIEHENAWPDEEADGFELLRRRRFGQTFVSFLRPLKGESP